VVLYVKVVVSEPGSVALHSSAGPDPKLHPVPEKENIAVCADANEAASNTSASCELELKASTRVADGVVSPAGVDAQAVQVSPDGHDAWPVPGE
jgi:hypothetical protein